MKEEKWGFRLVMAWASETSMLLSYIANRDPLYQSTTIRLDRTSTNVRTTVGTFEYYLESS